MKTLITAHSGCDETPDNSLQFLSYALQCGTDALEVDVRSASDGVLYLGHDQADISSPQLVQAFQMLRGSSMLINCDLKQPDLEEAVLALARRCGIAGQVLLSGTVSTERMRLDADIRARTLLNVRPILPGLDKVRIKRQMEALVRVCHNCGASVINVPYEMCTKPILDRLDIEGISVSAWTVNGEEDARRLLDWGIYNITTRRPRMVLALQKKRQQFNE